MAGRRGAPFSSYGVASGTLDRNNGTPPGVFGEDPVGSGRVEDGRERVGEIQRARMLAAMAEVASEHGAGNVTVAHVVERAGVSRRTFYEVFRDIEDCFLAALEDALARASERVLAARAAAGGARWRDATRAALLALLSFFDEEPYLGRLLVVEALGAGRPALERRSRLLAHVVAAVDEGSGEAKAKAGVTRLTAEGVVGGVLSVIHSRMLEGDRGGPLLDLAGPLMGMVVLPYLGPAVARRELNWPVSRPVAHTGTPGGNPLKDLHMRLTYRTVRVLAFVASNPGASNRLIGDASGIGDQGQISKLLARLQRLGLLENAAGGAIARGEPNAWALTDRGEQVHHALAARAATHN